MGRPFLTFEMASVCTLNRVCLHCSAASQRFSMTLQKAKGPSKQLTIRGLDKFAVCK